MTKQQTIEQMQQRLDKMSDRAMKLLAERDELKRVLTIHNHEAVTACKGYENSDLWRMTVAALQISKQNI